MSRSYYEWLAAKSKWFEAQRAEIANIPYPSETIDYPVVYKRESNNPYWQRRWAAAKEKVPPNITFNFELEQIQNFLQASAEFERAKEEEFLSKFYHGRSDTGESITDKFNILFQSRDLYSELNDKIKNILQNKQFQDNTTFGKSKNTTHEKFTGMAPTLSSVFITYFMPEFENELYNSYSLISGDSTVDQIAEVVDQALKNAIMKASERMANISQSRDNGQGWGNQWQPILEMLQRSDRASKMLQDALYDAIGGTLFEKLKENIQQNKQNRSDVSKDEMAQLVLNSLGNVRGRKASIGGTIAEVVIPLLAEAFSKGTTADNSLSYQMAGARFGSNVITTDAVLLYSTNMSLDLNDLLQRLNEEMNLGTTNTIREVYQRLESFWQWESLEKDLDELYQVYINAKNYGIGADGRNYTKTYNGQMDELPYFLQANGIQIDKASEFLGYVYSTGEGAVNADAGQGDLQEQLSNALKAAAANIMFDDYTEIGHSDTGNTRIIHMYYLSGKYIPASEVFSAMAEAAKDSNINSKATITLPGPIEDKFVEGSKEMGHGWEQLAGSNKDVAIKKAIYEHWITEANKAKAASTWSVSFTLRIKALLGSVV